MDKHDRPYKCGAVGCEKLPGFTYSGGLLRHEREVHGKHGGPKNPLHCPHESCKRATGKGFSRLENLNEHLRRVHTNTHNDGGTPTTNTTAMNGLGMLSNGISHHMHDESDEATSDDLSPGAHGHGHQATIPHPSHLLKRKRRHDSLGGSETSELREEIKRLRQENEELREQVQKNTQQTTLLVQKLQALTEAMVTTQTPRQSQPGPGPGQGGNNMVVVPSSTGAQAQMATAAQAAVATAAASSY